MSNRLSPTKKNFIKSFRLLAWLHALFFLSGSVFLGIFGAGEYEILLTIFIANGILSVVCGYFSEKNQFISGFSGTLAAVLYWFFSIAEGLYFGFIRGISFSVTLLGLLAVYLLWSKIKE